MNTSFDVNQYWLKRGQTYIREDRLGLDYHRVQERFLFDVLRAGQLPMSRMVEVGCGFGRVTKLLSENFPGAQITGLDLSPDQLANAKRYCAGRENIQFASYDFYSGQPVPGGGYDCAFAIEVFLHHPEPVIRALIGKLLAASQFVVSIDWSEAWPWKTPEHVWIHDYPKLYADAGLQCASFALPEKVEGKQQRLFVAGRALPAELIELERKLSEMPLTAATTLLTEGDEWVQQLERARQEILERIPADSTVILVNDDQWGEAQTLPDRRVIPFLEHEGQYWGAPADDATALRELKRLQQSGASHIIFAWSAFWWLDHYAGLRAHLASQCDCMLSNERVKIFQLNA